MTHDMSMISNCALMDVGQWSTTMDMTPLHLHQYQCQSRPYQHDLECDLTLHPDSPTTRAANTSTCDARALSCAACCIALVKVSEVWEACKPKSTAQKQQQPAMTLSKKEKSANSQKNRTSVKRSQEKVR